MPKPKRTRRLGVAFLMHPLKGWDFDGDTSLSIIAECHARGHAIYFMESKDLFLKNAALHAHLWPCRPDPRTGLTLGRREEKNLERMDCVVIRKEPPFDADYLSCTYLLDFLRGKTFLLNDPAGIRNTNEKLSSLAFPAAPRSVAGYVPDTLLPFIRSRRGRPVVLKRTDQKGGIGILKTSSRDPALVRKIRELSANGKRAVLAQEFIPHARTGDKRILLLDAKPVGTFVRYPPQTDFRANMAVGGTMGPGKLDRQDRAIIRSLRAFLRSNGLHFVGIDVIGGRLTEVNVTSPAGIPEVNALYGTRIEETVADFIEERSASLKRS